MLFATIGKVGGRPEGLDAVIRIWLRKCEEVVKAAGISTEL